MEINLEEQSLETLKDWAKSMNMKNISACRKQELINYLKTRIPDPALLNEKIEMVLQEKANRLSLLENREVDISEVMPKPPGKRGRRPKDADGDGTDFAEELSEDASGDFGEAASGEAFEPAFEEDAPRAAEEDDLFFRTKKPLPELDPLDALISDPEDEGAADAADAVSPENEIKVDIGEEKKKGLFSSKNLTVAFGSAARTRPGTMRPAAAPQARVTANANGFGRYANRSQGSEPDNRGRGGVQGSRFTNLPAYGQRPSAAPAGAPRSFDSRPVQADQRPAFDARGGYDSRGFGQQRGYDGRPYQQDARQYYDMRPGFDARNTFDSRPAFDARGVYDRNADQGGGFSASDWQSGREAQDGGFEDDFRRNAGDVSGTLEILQEGYGFLRCEGMNPSEGDAYVSRALIHKYALRTGDMVHGTVRPRAANEKNAGLATVDEINGEPADALQSRKSFFDMTPCFPNEKLHLENGREDLYVRLMDILCPIGKGQRGMLIAPPRTGRTTLIKQLAASVMANHPEMQLYVLLIDERPEDVTDIKESIVGDNVEIVPSTFDESAEHHRRAAEITLGRAQRQVERGRDVMILLDDITHLTRTYNDLVTPGGRMMTCGLDPAALNAPKRFFGSARNMKEGGSLTILATALVENGSELDRAIFEEFRGDSNMEVILSRSLAEQEIFPAIDIARSRTRNEELLLDRRTLDSAASLRHAVLKGRTENAEKTILEMLAGTETNAEFLDLVQKTEF